MLNGITHGHEVESDELNIKQEVLAVIDEALGLGGRARTFDLDTPLLGAVPELDSMAVVGVLNLLEERFDFIVDDDEIDGSAFASVGTLVAFVEGKLARAN
ncbi:MAG: acyl carrier protein [Azoarcus sp.]|nr:acyl carrier protein [Azoarcus sp.]